MGEYIVHVIYRSAAKSYTIECYDKADAYNNARRITGDVYVKVSYRGKDIAYKHSGDILKEW